ncbi:MAG: 50S ribosomal protein L24 [Bacteroidales bacterium]|nr:50S ribosomal protein L24 [Bacteroidales bacterium]
MKVKLNIRKGDTVKVISGESKGKQGRVLKVIAETGRAVVEGVNLMKKHSKPNADNPQGGIIEQEAAVHISNLMVVDGKGVATRIAIKKDEKTGKSVRFSKKSGEEIK